MKVVLLTLLLTVLSALVHGFRGRLGSHLSRHLSTSLNMATVSSQSESRKIVAPIFDEKCDEMGITLTRYMVEFVSANPHMRELESLLISVQLGALMGDSNYCFRYKVTY